MRAAEGGGGVRENFVSHANQDVEGCRSAAAGLALTLLVAMVMDGGQSARGDHRHLMTEH